MTDPDTYHAMTDDQLAEWVRRGDRIRALTAELCTARAALDAIQVLSWQEAQKHRNELNEARAVALDATRKHTDQLDAARRSAAALVIVLKALHHLATVCDLPDPTGDWGPPGEEFRKAIREANEVLRAYGFPF